MDWQIKEKDVCQGTLPTICNPVFSVLLPLIIPDTNEQKLTAIYQQLTHKGKLTFFIQLSNVPLDKEHKFKDSVRNTHFF
jgi:hypothetical protein